MGLFRALITLTISSYIVNIINKKKNKYKKYIKFKPINDLIDNKYKLLIIIFLLITIIW